MRGTGARLLLRAWPFLFLPLPHFGVPLGIWITPGIPRLGLSGVHTELKGSGNLVPHFSFASYSET